MDPYPSWSTYILGQFKITYLTSCTKALFPNVGILIPSPLALLRGLNKIIRVKDSANLSCYDQWLAILWIQNSALRILFSFWTKQIHLYKPFSAQCSTKGIYRHSMRVEPMGQTSHNCQAHRCGPGSKAKKKKKMITKAVELCVIQAEVCTSWWEDWNFTFRQTVRKCSKTSTAKRSTSVCYTPNDARTEPRVPQILRGLLLLLWLCADKDMIHTI